MKTVLLLGASGSIGSQTLDIIRDNPNDFKLVAFSVGNRHEKIDEILKNHQEVHSIYLISEDKAIEYKVKYPHIKFYSGEKGLAKLTNNADYEMCVEALVGIAGLEPAVIALKRNKILCLANKEALVTGGHIINNLLNEGKGKLYPIDSEHVALAKCLKKVKPEEIDKLIITASGGALRNVPLDELDNKKASDALNHPTWKMGAKITIDCATMMNKGFEVIEAYYLFGYGLDKIEVLMHDESLVHSMVKTKDGRYIIDYGKPDMHNPIRYAMYEGKAFLDTIEVRDLNELKDCHFHKFDPKRYPCVLLAKDALKQKGLSLVALNASNEICVNAYLKDKISFLNISKTIARIMSKVDNNPNPSLEEVLNFDKYIRDLTKEMIK